MVDQNAIAQYLREIADTLEAGVSPLSLNATRDFERFNVAQITITPIKDELAECSQYLKECVLDGFCAITRHFGDVSWARKVSIQSLDMRNIFECTGGQVFGSYTTALEVLFGNAYDKGVTHGLSLSGAIGDDRDWWPTVDRDDAWNLLTEHWTDILESVRYTED